MTATIFDLVASRDTLAAALAKRRSRAYQPKSKRTLDEWADDVRRVPSGGVIAGKWRTENVEVARGPMRLLSDPRVRSLDMMAGAQIFKTTVMETNIGYRLLEDPGQMLFYSSSQGTIDTTVTNNVDPMIINSPKLAALWGGAKALEIKNEKFTKGLKRTPGSSVQFLTMNSTANLRNRSARDVMVDELDDCGATIDGDPYKLAASRSTMFKGRERIITGSTPTVRGRSPIEKRFLFGDQRRPLVECPSCGQMDWFHWSQTKFRDENDKIKPDIAVYRCAHCEHAWTAAERIKLLTTRDGIFWGQTKTFSCCGETQEPMVEQLWDREWDPNLPAEMGRAICKHCGEKPVPVTHASVTASIFYNPNWSLPDIVRDFLDCNGDPQALRVFINNRLGETWEDRDDQLAEIDVDSFSARTEISWDAIPEGVKILTMGVDVQPQGSQSPGRLEAELVGWGDGEETWSLGYHVIEGNPDDGAVWAILDEIRTRAYPAEDGRTLYVQASCIDSGGHNQDAVMSYCGAPGRANKRVWAIKGSSETGIGSRMPIWPLVAPKTEKHGAKLYMIGTLSAKDWIASCASKTQPGPRYMHVPADRHEGWFGQLLSEKRVSIHQKGRSGSTWIPRASGVRTEALDCRVYAKAAWEGLKKQFPKVARLVQSAAAAALPVAQDGDSADPAPANDPAPVAARRNMVRRR